MRDTLTESTRLGYLDSLGIDVWRSRGAEEVSVNTEADMAEVVLETWDDIRAAVSNCRKCALHETRTQTVFGVGSETADWMIIGEAPGAEEDRRGEPFVGKAGKLLDEMLRAVGLDRKTVFIANVLKCRPPGNRDPKTDESSRCRAYLDRQIELLRPKIIVAVGRIAAQLLLDTDAPLGQLRGQLHHIGAAETPVVATYHPAYLLRSPTQKCKAWQDLCMARTLVRKQAA
jgi:DNA polymerase